MGPKVAAEKEPLLNGHEHEGESHTAINVNDINEIVGNDGREFTDPADADTVPEERWAIQNHHSTYF